MENNNLVTAKVIYKDTDAGNKPVYRKVIAGKVNSPVRLEQYKQYIPKNFTFEGYGRFNRVLKNHDVDVIYVREHHVTAKGHIVVDYINSNNQLINRNTFTNRVGSHFDVNKCKATIPKDYQFKRILTGSNINTYKSDSQIMVVQVIQRKHVNITIKYLSKGTSVGVAHARGLENAPFKIDQYVRNIPNGYVFVKIANKIPQVFDHDQVINIDVNKKVNPKPHNVPKNHNHSSKQSNNDPQKIGQILMRLAASLHALGKTISKNNQL